MALFCDFISEQFYLRNIISMKRWFTANSFAIALAVNFITKV